jgi:hypothetical protein
VLFFHNENWPSTPPTSSGMQPTYWNLWRTRRPVYRRLELGSRVVLVRTWPRGSVLAATAQVTHLVRCGYTSKDEAVELIAAGLDMTVADVAGNGYTRSRPDGPGWVVAWRGPVVTHLDVPRPPGLRIGQDGWLVVDDRAALAAWGLTEDGDVRRER